AAWTPALTAWAAETWSSSASASAESPAAAATSTESTASTSAKTGATTAARTARSARNSRHCARLLSVRAENLLTSGRVLDAKGRATQSEILLPALQAVAERSIHQERFVCVGGV